MPSPVLPMIAAIAALAPAAANPVLAPQERSRARCVGVACDDRVSEPSHEAESGFCALHVASPGEATAFVRNRTGEPRFELNWRIPVAVARSRGAYGLPPIEEPGSHLYLMFRDRSRAPAPLPAAPALERITLGLSFGYDAPERLAGDTPRIGVVAAGRLFGPFRAGPDTYRAAAGLHATPNQAVPETPLPAATLKTLLAALRVGPAMIQLFDSQNRLIAEGPLVASPTAADVEQAVIWARGAERFLPRGRCPRPPTG